MTPIGHRSPGELLLGGLLEMSHDRSADDLPTAVARAAEAIGAADVVLYLTDHEQRVLVPLVAPGAPAPQPLDIDTTLAGRAFRTTRLTRGGGTGDGPGGGRIWVPLLDGTDRLGVMGLTLEQVEPVTASRCEQFAALVAELILTKSAYGDAIALVRRRREMDLAAELRWALLPPLTFTSARVAIAGILEPAYQIAGDAFDYAVNGDLVHLAIVDAMGHGLEASRIANLAVASYRHSRRRGLSLTDTFQAVDEVVAREFGTEKFVTGQLARLALPTGRLEWLSAGHPRPLLLRQGAVVGELAGENWLPLGLGDVPAQVAEASLEPEDSLLFFTDGVVEARAPSGEQFGRDRLADLLQRAAASKEPPPEMVRRLCHAVLDHQAAELTDDATLVLLSWPGGRTGTSG